jgi:phospholipase C
MRTARFVGAGLIACGLTAPLATAGPGRAAPASPIRHVVIVFQENHSFDNVLGRFCAGSGRCDGATSGVVSDGSTVPLADAADLIPIIEHSHLAEVEAIDGGKMDGFDRVTGCHARGGYACYTQFVPSAIPNLTALATSFALSDRTFETTTASSWVSHLALVASTSDGFYGDNPLARHGVVGPGGGCDSFKDTLWATGWGSAPIFVPSCVPDRSGRGPYRPSPVRWVPTIMDRLDGAGLEWRLYAGGGPTKKGTWQAGYFWQVCSMFAECQLGPQRENWADMKQVLSDAAAGSLPAVSLVTPTLMVSQHNRTSMLKGDNWIGRVVSSLETGPEWSSTAIFITYDDCGCFYDHVPPHGSLGIRVPMVIVSPYARPGFTDSHVASFDSMLAYIEHLFGLAPLASGDAAAYDYRDAFDYARTPLPPVSMVMSHVPQAEMRFLGSHPPDENDPT